MRYRAPLGALLPLLLLNATAPLRANPIGDMWDGLASSVGWNRPDPDQGFTPSSGPLLEVIVVRPDPENDRRFAAAQRVSEINLGLYRSLLQPLVQATTNEQTAELMKKLNPSELPFEIFSDRNPLMHLVAQLAEQVRQQRQPHVGR